MKRTLFLIGGWSVVVILISSVLIIGSESFFINGTVILGWMLFMLQFTWNYSENFYMNFKKWWFFIKNPDCLWNMQVEYIGSFDEKTIATISEVFAKQQREFKFIQLSDSRVLYKLRSLTFEIVIEHNIVRIHLEDLEVSFRRSQRIIEEELALLLEDLSRALKEDESNFYFNVNFKQFNPYYGFFIRRLKAKDISTFNVKFNVEDDKVTINKDSIEIYTSSLQKLNQFSKRYLSLSPR